MKIGPLEVTRASLNGNGKVEAASAAAKSASARRKEYGASGTYNVDGYLVPSDYNRELTGKSGLMVWERMRRSDAAVREALWHIFAPIINATWDLEPASDDVLDLEVAEFGRRCFTEWLEEPFSQTVRTALLYLPQGFQVFELTEKVVEAEITYDVPLGEAVTCPRRQFVVWSTIAHRRPETIDRWLTDGSKLKGVKQSVMAKGEYATPEIPAEALLVFTNEKEGDEWTGTSILRSSYKSWALKELVEKIAGMAYERHGVGIPIGYLPESQARDEVALQRMEDILRDLRAGEHHYVAFPGPKASQSVTGRDGYFIEILAPASSIPDFLPFLEYLRGDIKGNVLARFAELGHGSVGARATGDVQSQVWYDALQGTANYVAAVFERALHSLIDKNYIVERYPKVVARDIETRNLEEYANSVSKLVTAGAVIADASLRAAVRDFFGWPDEDEPEEAGLEEPVIEEDEPYDPSDVPAPEDQQDEPAEPPAEEDK